MNIPTRICPICSKKLLMGDEDTAYDFYCKDFYLRYFVYDWHNMNLIIPNNVEFTGGKIKEPHYSVVVNNKVWTQSTIIPPYWIMSNSETKKSKIYHFPKEIQYPDDRWLLLEIPMLSPIDYVPENFARKIKNLVIFS